MGETRMRRKIYAVFLLVVLLCVQNADLAKAGTVYEESLTLRVAIFKTMGCNLFVELSVTTLNGPFDASEFTNDPEFHSFYVSSAEGLTNEISYEADMSPRYNVTYRTDVQVYVNGTGFTPTLHGLRVAEALKSKIEDMFSIILLYVPERTSSKDIPYTDFYSFLSNVSIVDQFWNIFKMQNFLGFSELFTSNPNIEAGYVELRLEKIGSSYMWTYKMDFSISGPPKIEFGQEYTLSLNDMLGRSEDISSALGASASNISVEFWMGDDNWTFVPLGIEPIMIKTQDNQQGIVFSTDIAGTRVTDVKIRFKILEKAENYLAMYVAVVVLGAFSCIVGSYLLKRRRLRSSHYKW
jgi:hypothetical protein